MPSSCRSFRATACSVSSPQRGWEQHVLLQSPPQWYLESALFCIRTLPRPSWRMTENALWSTHFSCASVFGTGPSGRSSRSTAMRMSSMMPSWSFLLSLPAVSGQRTKSSRSPLSPGGIIIAYPPGKEKAEGPKKPDGKGSFGNSFRNGENGTFSA